MKLLWKPRVRPAEPARPRAFCQGSWMVIFWCKCGVNRKDRFRKMLTYQAFPPSGSYPAVTEEEYLGHALCAPSHFVRFQYSTEPLIRRASVPDAPQMRLPAAVQP